MSLEEGRGAPTCHWLAPLHSMVGHRLVAPWISLLWPLAAKKQDNNGKVQFFPVLTNKNSSATLSSYEQNCFLNLRFKNAQENRLSLV